MIDLNYYGWNDKLNQLKQESTYGTLTMGVSLLYTGRVMRWLPGAECSGAS